MKKAKQGQSYEGKLERTRSGVGYVIVEELDSDILVPSFGLLDALHGDKVRVRVMGDDKRTGKARGKLTHVIARGQQAFVGHILKTDEGRWIARVYNVGVAVDFPIEDEHIESFDKVEKRAMIRLGHISNKRQTYARVERFFTEGEADDSKLATILLEKNFILHFSKETLAECENLPQEIEQLANRDNEMNRQRVDFRDRFTCTIDPDDAKDFDDALSLKKLDDGLLEIGVHIADVSYFVRPHTALDADAYERATSVYLPGRVLPMLPEQLSNHLCSLMPHTDRYAMSMVAHINPKNAEVKHVYFARTLIHSNHRFTYEQAQKIIEQTEDKQDETSHTIHLLQHIAHILRRDRIANGAINFLSEEVKFILDENRFPIDAVRKEIKQAHNLVEEFMLLANRLVATYLFDLQQKGQPLFFPYRIHDTPDSEKLLAFAQFVKKQGYDFDISTPIITAKSYNHLLQEVRDKPEGYVFDKLGIRAMAKAIYSAKNIGHYGLGFSHYVHFTSPIRRYPDILTHRALWEALQKEGRGDPINKKEAFAHMEDLSAHCSERERAAVECERTANKYKQTQYMSAHIGKRFKGIISGVGAQGFWVETLAHKCEGMVSLRTLWEVDNFVFVPEDWALVGTRTKKRYRFGQLVEVEVLACNMEKFTIDYALVL